MFFNSFQTLNTNFMSGFNAFAFPQFSFMPISWNFNNFTPLFDFNQCRNIWNFNNFNSNIWNTNTGTYTQTYTTSTNTDSFVKTSTDENNTNNNKELKDYNSFAGHRLAQIAMQGRQFNSWKNVPDGQGRCAFFVSNALERAGMSNGMRGHAYQMIDILKYNNNFKQISPDNVDLDELPAGSILAYKRGSQGYSKEFGHIEILTEDGKGVSQAITNNVKAPDAIFIPV